MAKRKIMVSAFEAFGSNAVNPTEEALARLAAPADAELCRVLLPVTWDGSFATLSAAWDRFLPDAVLMTGLAGGTDAIQIERLGVNLCGAIPDNRGLYPDGTATGRAERPIAPEAPDALFATYPHARLAAALRERQIPHRISFSAGTYLCNNILFSSLWRGKREGQAIPIGFIHVPYRENQKEDAPFLPLETTVRALETILSNLF